jgi:eukaryotic-like serine/threonine-protein kinase
VNPEHWAEIDRVLSGALALDEHDRAAYLTGCCGDKPAIRAEVESLLASHQRATGFIETDSWIEATASEPSIAEPAAGSRVGPYRLVREIGRGGMGTVFLGERDDGQFRKQVAIKLIGAGIASAESLERFRGERQILARLEHPNIARLLDGGVAENGSPYIAMEYIEGRPIHEYSASQQLSQRQRVELFRSVCSAVHFAHRNLVVHRDIKPGNILVTEEGVAKLLDFGVAKLLNAADAGSQETVTSPWLRAMSLDYASPEQVRGLPVTTTSDIYSLGVLLYELLAGKKPYTLASKTLDEVLRLLAVEEPISPSISNRELAGDLEAIILKAMRKEPGERYASAEELSEDLGRYLAGQPVSARHASFRYLAGKYIARHRSRAAALAVGVVLLLAGAGAIAWEARVANLERAKAQRRFDDLRKLASSMVFEVNQSLAQYPGSTPARKLLVTRGLEYLDALANESQGDPSLQREVGTAYLRMGDIQGNIGVANLGDVQGANSSYEKGRRILIAAVAKSPGDVDASLSLVEAHRKLSNSYIRAGNSAESLRAAREAVTVAESIAKAKPAEDRVRRSLGSAYFALAMALTDADQSLQIWQKCLDLYMSLLGDRPQADRELRNVALVHKYMSGRFRLRSLLTQALDHARLAEEMDSRRVAAQPSSRQAQIDLTYDFGVTADCYQEVGDNERALDRYQRSLDIRRRLAEADPKDARLQALLAYSETRVADTLLNLGRVSDALERFQTAARMGKAQSGSNSADATVRSNWALALYGEGEALDRLGRRDEACSSYRSALAIYEDFARRGVAESDYLNDQAPAWAARVATCRSKQ